MIRERLLLPRRIFWFCLLVELLLTMVLGASLFVFPSTPGLVGREIMRAVFFHTLAWEGLVVVGVLLANMVTPPPLLPLSLSPGALLGERRRLAVHRVQTACPLGLDPAMGEGASLYCWSCGECVESRRTGALRLGYGLQRERSWRERITGPTVEKDSRT